MIAEALLAITIFNECWARVALIDEIQVYREHYQYSREMMRDHIIESAPWHYLKRDPYIEFMDEQISSAYDDPFSSISFDPYQEAHECISNHTNYLKGERLTNEVQP